MCELQQAEKLLAMRHGEPPFTVEEDCLFGPQLICIAAWQYIERVFWGEGLMASEDANTIG